MFQNFAKDFTLAWQHPASALFGTLVGESHLPVHGHLVDAVVAFDQFGFQAELLGDGSRQPGGPIIKTSFNTIGDLNERFPFLIFCHNRLLESAGHAGRL